MMAGMVVTRRILSWTDKRERDPPKPHLPGMLDSRQENMLGGEHVQWVTPPRFSNAIIGRKAADHTRLATSACSERSVPRS